MTLRSIKKIKNAVVPRLVRGIQKIINVSCILFSGSRGQAAGRQHKHKILILFLLIGICHAAPVTPAHTDINYLLNIKNLIAEDGFVMRNEGGSRDLYLPLLPNWDIHRIHVHLLLTRDKAENADSLLTASIKNYPISSINLPISNTGETTWDFDIPAQYLDGKLITLNIKRNMNTSGANCNNLLNDGIWVNVSGNSTIQYNYSEKTYQPNLSAFPVPFVNDPSINKDEIVIMMPENTNNKNLEMAYYTGKAFIKRESWRGVDLIGVISNTASQEVKSNHHIVMIGPADQIQPLLNNLKLPLQFNAQHQWIDNQNKLIPDNTGIIILIASPWNNTKAFMIVTGNSDQGVMKAAQALRHKTFSQSVLFNQYVLVNQLSRPHFSTIDWSDTSLKELGFNDMTIFGRGDHSIKYTINLPTNRLPQEMDIAFQYSLSPLLSSRNNSFLSIYMNGLPVTATRIEPESNNKQTWKVHIDGINLLPGKNELDCRFNLKFYNADCAPDDTSLSWATIYDTSQLKIYFDQKKLTLNFDNFNEAGRNIALLLPKNKSAFSNEQLLNIVLNIAEDVFQIKNLTIMEDSDNLENITPDSNIIYVGNINDNNLLNHHREYLPFYYFDNKLAINQSILSVVHVSDETPIGLIELAQSPLNTEQALLLITANKPENFKTVIDVFFNPQKNKYIRDDAVLIYDDGTYTSINVDNLKKKVENKRIISNTKRLTMIGMITFIIIFFGGIICLILYRRIKEYFYPSQ